jgi:ADP-ribosylglycohydrolase
MPVSNDYVERVYAGVLGKLIGVYLGRPFESWSYDRIRAELGDVTYYVHERFGVPLIVTDDDISGTFTFLRALPDYGCTRDLSAAQIGNTWLNYIIEGKTILWWGGMGNSTEETAYVRLTQGIEAPHSGSMRLNSQLVAEQIGAQIFIDGWAMVAPGDPELAASFAQKAASVSHDGVAVHAAMLIAAMEAQAFVEPDIHKLLDVGLSVIPSDSIIARLIGDLQAWHVQDQDWRTTRERIAAHYGYDKFGGNCHVVPNHAIVILSLLYSDDSFDRALMIANTCGWDTDCNSGNVGCLMGIKNGLAGLEAGQNWRTPVADRLFLSSADGGRAITDAVTETYHVVNMGLALGGKPHLTPKGGARFHFELPGSVQGFRVEDDLNNRTATLKNVVGHSAKGTRSLEIRFSGTSPERPTRVATATFIPPEAISMPGYGFVACPTLYPGQTVQGRVDADETNAGLIKCRPYVSIYGADDLLERRYGDTLTLLPGGAQSFSWRPDDTEGAPIAEVGLEISEPEGNQSVLYLDYLGWSGAPKAVWRRPRGKGQMWTRAWASTMDHVGFHWPNTFHLSKSRGTGMYIQGTRDWNDYEVGGTLTPQVAKSFGIANRVQGLRRYYALLMCHDQMVRLVKVLDEVTVLQELPFKWAFGSPYSLILRAKGGSLQASVDGVCLLDVVDESAPLVGGGIALLCEEGLITSPEVAVRPV